MIILATGNSGKIAELSDLLSPYQCIPQSQLGISDIPETGVTFVENALLKARHASNIAKSPALADDSGLVVEALGGEPGLYSARYATLHNPELSNVDCLLSRMQGIPLEKRQAYFYCVVVWMRHADDPAPVIATGRWHGLIATEATGTGGFGYDPIFYLPDYQCTVAQLAKDVKNKLSHRAIALAQLREALDDDTLKAHC
ncbi:MAG: RdgB/HAM1 family non-canonical purine NTP pyrophosphatase [Gammaproteobacteria bacterium]|nr:RdgB/HAM1 family non-canonical purine NTP pyrophosphatase [Gammaproteobacteria bacterium]